MATRLPGCDHPSLSMHSEFLSAYTCKQKARKIYANHSEDTYD